MATMLLGDFIEELQKVESKRGPDVIMLVEDSDGELYSPTLEFIQPMKNEGRQPGRLVIHGWTEEDDGFFLDGIELEEEE